MLGFSLSGDEFQTFGQSYFQSKVQRLGATRDQNIDLNLKTFNSDAELPNLKVLKQVLQTGLQVLYSASSCILIKVFRCILPVK